MVAIDLAAARPAIERSTMRKVYWRLLPLSILAYFLCYLDRINVGFAALTMNKDLGLDAAVYGMAAGAFFWGYFLFEVPSNIILEKVGARMWIARIMVSWGVLSGATAFCVGPWSFFIMRFLLGLAEAGLFPGMILFFTYWFPDWHRARIVSGFMVALPLAVAVGSPVSTAIAGTGWCRGSGRLEVDVHRRGDTDGIGRFLHLVLRHRSSEPRALARVLTSVPGSCPRSTPNAIWSEAKRQVSVWQSFWDPKILLLTLYYFGINGASLGMLLFLPQIVKQLGLSNMEVGWVSMIPYLFGAVAMLAWGWLSDRMAERRWKYFWAAIASMVGLIIAAQTVGTVWAVVGMSIAAIGFYGSKGPFWAMPSLILTGTAAASGIAWINGNCR